MSAENNGVLRTKPIPLDAFNNAYIQSNTAAATLNTNGSVVMGKTQPNTALGLKDPTSSWVEVDGGNGFIFHTGSGATYKPFDAKIMINFVDDVAGGSSIVLMNNGTLWEFNTDGSIGINGDYGTAGQNITSAGPGLAISWA